MRSAGYYLRLPLFFLAFLFHSESAFLRPDQIEAGDLFRLENVVEFIRPPVALVAVVLF